MTISVAESTYEGFRFGQTQKGPRQGDLKSPIMLNIVADILAILIGRDKEDVRVEGFIPHLVDGGVSIL